MKFLACLLAILLVSFLPDLASGTDTDDLELLFYGQFVQAVYDGVDAGNSTQEFISNAARFNPQDGYNITRLLYCAEKFLLEENQTAWIGYMAHSQVKGDVAIVLRGTTKMLEWVENSMAEQVPFNYNGSLPTDPKPLVHAGFSSLYNSADSGQESLRAQIMGELTRIVQSSDVSTVTFAGHSLGGAVSIMSSLDIANSNVSSSIKSGVRVYTFAAPMTGDHTFSQMVGDTKSLRILRVSDLRDIVPYLPSLSYEHAGEELKVDGCLYPYPGDKYNGSSLLDRVRDYHQLGRYLNTVSHLSAGTLEFEAAAFRRRSRLPKLRLGHIAKLYKFMRRLFKNIDDDLWDALEDYLENFIKDCPNRP